MTVPDAPLTELGKKQAASLAPYLRQLQNEVDLVVSSPLKRTLQTTKLAYAPAIERLGGLGKVICLPEAQECNDFPCDTGSPREVLESDPEFAGFDLSRLTQDWTSKQGFWAADDEALSNRARAVRQFLRRRPEATVVLVAHGDILRRITCDVNGPSTYMWKNAEARIFSFDPSYVDSDECYLHQEENACAMGGYGPTSTDADVMEFSNGKL